MNLWGTAEGIGILDTIAVSVIGKVRRTVHQPHHAISDMALSDVRPHVVDFSGKRTNGASARFKGHAKHGVGHREQRMQPLCRKGQQRGHLARTVDQRQTVLRSQWTRYQSVVGQDFDGRLHVIAEPYLPFANQSEGDVGKRCQIA